MSFHEKKTEKIELVARPALARSSLLEGFSDHNFEVGCGQCLLSAPGNEFQQFDERLGLPREDFPDRQLPNCEDCLAEEV